MSKVKFFDAVLKKETSGLTSVVQGATVSVYKTGTAVLATLYDNDATTPIANPLTTDSNGNYNFIAEEGLYDIRIVYTGYDETNIKFALGASSGTFGVNTGLIKGGAVSINTDTTKFDIAAGYGQIADGYTDAEEPTVKIVQWGDLLANSATYISTAATSFLFIDSNGSIVQSVSFPSNGDLRDKIQIGSIVHPDNATITGVSDFSQAPLAHTAQTLTDLTIAIGVINESGNAYFGNSGTLKIEKTTGVSMYAGIDFKNDPKDPNRKNTPVKAADTNFIYTWRDGAGGFNTKNTNIVQVALYDDNSVTTTSPAGSVSTNQWVIDRIYYSPDADTTVVQVGQNTYNSQSSALNALSNGTDTFEQDPQFSGVPLRTFMLRRGGASDLSDIGDANFKDAGRFGGAGGAGGAGAGGVPSMQSVYEASVTPEIVTDAALGAVSIKAGVANTDDQLEVLNTSGTQTYAVNGNGALSVYGASLLEKTSNYTLTSADSGKVIHVNSGSNLQITVPTGLSTGFNVTITRYGAGTVEILPSSTTVNSISGNKMIKDQYGAVTIIQKATNEYLLAGSLEA